jgi:glucose/mannose-6-phosphate isomerase
MLDDLKLIHERDADDTLGIAERQCRQLDYTPDIAPELRVEHISKVVYAGMGGSALAPSLVGTWPTVNVPFEIVRGYDIPSYVDGSTLFIAASYSGNTEETLEALAQAENKGAQIAVIAGGGKLTDIAREKGYTLGVLPKAEQPRYAVFYNFRILLTLLRQAGLIGQEALDELAAARPFLEESVKQWVATVPTDKNPAKKLALECIGKSVVVYSGPKLMPVAYKWKISFNENAKQVAWWNFYPEFNHNEFIGWSKQPTDKPYTIIDLRSNLEHERVQKRFEVSERLLSGMRPAPHIVEAQGGTILDQLLWTIAFGDFVTLYVGLLNGLNPAPVELVEKLKKELG